MFLEQDNELNLIKDSKYDYILGIDEAGRGCLAGPVYVSGYIFMPGNEFVEGIYDSKKVPVKTRENIFSQINSHPNVITFASNDQIDSRGIATAIEDLISEIINKTRKEYGLNGLVLIDGRFKKKFGDNTKQIIKGDTIFYSIAAASILSKVSRDKQMEEFGKDFPLYKFEKHKGYATKLHRTIILQNGTTPLHRKTFRTDKNLDSLTLI